MAIIIAIIVVISSQRSEMSASVRMAVLLPLTGSGSDQGEWVKQGFEVALRDVNKSAKYKIELTYQDTQGAPKNTISAYNQLKPTRTMPVVFTWGSGAGIALTPIVNKDKVIQVGVATAADSYSTPDDYTFRNFPSASQEAQFSADAVLNTLKKKSVSILKINNDYGLSSAKAFGALYVEKGGRVISEDVFEPGTTDFRTQLTKIKSTSPDLVFLATYPTEGALLLRQAKELGLNVQFMASVAILGGKDFFNVAGDSADGLIVISSVPPLTPDATGELGNFVREYEEMFKSPISSQQIYAARSYDALKIVSKSLDACGTNTDCIRDFLFNVRGYAGASGTFSFDRNGDVSAHFYLQKIKGGTFVPF